MSNNILNIKVRIYITDPWDSKEVIDGILQGEVLVDNIKSALIYDENGKWVVLLPRHKGQDLHDELENGKETATNIVWLSNDFDEKNKKIHRALITSYSSGNAIRLE